MLHLFLVLPAAAAGYQDPPPAVAAVLDAPRPPQISLSRDDSWMLELSRPELPSIAELAAPRLRVAGLQLDPRTRGPAGEQGYTAMTLRPTGRHDRVERQEIALPEDARIGRVAWSFDDSSVAFTNTVEDGIELWVLDVASATPRRLLGPVLNATHGQPCAWLGHGRSLVCTVVSAGQGPPPERDPVPTGPRIAESEGRIAPGRTWQNLIVDAHDAALFEHALLSEVVEVDLDGSVRPLLPSDWYEDLNPSPDAQWLLFSRLKRPWSTTVPASRFPRRSEVLSLADGSRRTVAELPLADEVPIAFNSVRTGRRIVSWRADKPATLWFVEALDGGDAAAPAQYRDALSELPAPFTDPPSLLWRSELRFSSVRWGDEGLALVSESWWKTRRTRTWRLRPGQAEAVPELLWDRSSQDRYSDPGTPLSVPGPYGWSVLRVEDGALLLTGDGWSPEGMFPFYDRYDLDTKQSERLWRSREPHLERVVSVLDSPRQFITLRQSASEPPNYLLRRLGSPLPLALTDFPDWAPAFASVRKEVVQYTRADGLPLSATLYLPPGYEPKRDGPLPTVFWAYPGEFKSRQDAGQLTRTDLNFSRPAGSSHLFFLLQGYAVVDDAAIPIIGEGEEEPNDTFVEQLVAGAEAVVQTMVQRGVSDPDRLVVGGHSYGAFMVAHLLAHTDLFRAGIARSGAYNRLLTPFGFQGEERTFWQAPETYLRLSPFTHAARIDEPILLLHGAEDSNSGTWPFQSERLYEAIKGLGGTARWVVLPVEDHGYRARESVGHVLWEMMRWAELHTTPETSGPQP